MCSLVCRLRALLMHIIHDFPCQLPWNRLCLTVRPRCINWASDQFLWLSLSVAFEQLWKIHCVLPCRGLAVLENGSGVLQALVFFEFYSSRTVYAMGKNLCIKMELNPSFTGSGVFPCWPVPLSRGAVVLLTGLSTVLVAGVGIGLEADTSQNIAKGKKWWMTSTHHFFTCRAKAWWAALWEWGFMHQWKYNYFFNFSYNF